MKKDMAAFLQDLLKQNAKHRRMTAFFTALSLIVSSGVIWALHGVGVTMVNDADIAAESHVHSDTCYEQRLICGAEENETHTHTAECYVNELICSEALQEADASVQTVSVDDAQEAPSEIIIDADAVTDMQPDSETEPDTSTDAEAGSDTETEPDAETGKEDEANLKAGPMPVLRAPGAGDGPGDPQVITTVDNIAEGIRFTLFDYGDNTLEDGKINYYGETDRSNVKKTGINTGRDPAEDLMFFAYGSVPPHGEQIGTDASGNPIYAPGTHDMNYYAGDYRDNSYQSGNRPFQGIVKNTLVDGFPELTVSGHSLAYLFNTEELKDADNNTYKSVYQNVNHLLKAVPSPSGSGTHLVYNSNENYAYFNPETNNFEVYDRTFDIINDAHHKKNDRKKDPNNNNLALVYGDDKDPGFKIGFFPFNEYNEELRDPNWDGDGYNHHFGMAMEAKFVNLEYDKINVKDPITFKYSGDDDMWVFVDNQLVLDIGGIHEPTGGMIDFSNDLVWVQDNDQGKTLAEVKAELFASKLLTENTDKGETQDSIWNELPKPIGIDTASTTQNDGNKWIVKPISYFYPDWANVKHDTHTIKMFYMERGGCYSNLAMEMNLPTVKSLTVTKDVDFQSHTTDYFDNNEYEFQIYEKIINTDTGEEEWVIPTDIESHFKLKANGRKQFDNIGCGRIFKVVELGVNPQIYDLVSVNGSNTVLNPDAPLQNIESAANTIGYVSAYGFRNRIREDTEDVAAKKNWMPALSSGDALNDFRVKFKLYRTDSITGEKLPVALRVTEGETEKLKRTFVLDKNNNWSWFAPGLPSRYGNHTYTYSVEELNVPKNYKATYDVAANGTLQIINTNQNNAKVNVKKEWTNGGEQPVELTLKRKRIGYTGSEATSLKVEIYDTKSNKITETSINEVYVGGSVEFALNVPKGVVYRGVKSKTPDSLEINYDSGFFEISNLAESSNIIQLEVDNDNAEDSILLVHSPFTFSTDGWSTQGAAKIWTSGNNPYAKGNAMGVQNVQEGTALPAKSGPILKLDPAKFKPGKTYSFSVYIRTDTGSSPVYQMVFNDGIGNEKIIGTLDNPNGWTQLQGNIQLPENLGPYNMYIRIGTSVDNAATKYYIDEFTAVEGDIPVSVTSNSGEITVGSPDNPVTREVYGIRFTGTLYDGWSIHGSPQLSGTGADNGNYLRISGRSHDYDSISNKATFLQVGHAYRFILNTKQDAPNGETGKVGLLLVYSASGNIALCLTSLGSSGADIEGIENIEIPQAVDRMYFVADGTGSYILKSLQILDLQADMAGYTRTSNGVYVSNYSEYNIDFDTDSITNPLKLTGEYVDDTAFSSTITLNSGNEWKYSWNNTTLDENNNNFLYQYYVVETKIGGITVNAPDSMGRILSADGNYLVSYDNDFIAANTENSPITVINKYIWYKLPDTGGIGADGVCAAGMMLAIGGFAGRIAFRKRERRNM